MPLSSKDRAHLRGLAHHLDPVVLVGQGGVSEAVIAKVGVELLNHELIKVRVGDGPIEVDEAVGPLVEGTGAELVQVIGRMIVLYRRREKDRQVFLAGEKAPRERVVREPPAPRGRGDVHRKAARAKGARPKPGAARPTKAGGAGTRSGGGGADGRGAGPGGVKPGGNGRGGRGGGRSPG